MFDSDLTNPTQTAEVVLSSGQIDPSHIINDEFCVHFSIAPPTTTALDSNLKFELQITIRRRGCLNRKIKFVTSTHCLRRHLLTVDLNLRMKQWIMYSTRPDTPNVSPLLQTPARKPRNLPSSWKANDYPGVIVKGVIFQQDQVEVECKVSNEYQVQPTPRSVMTLLSSSLYRHVTPFCYCPPPYLLLTFLDFVPRV